MRAIDLTLVAFGTGTLAATGVYGLLVVTLATERRLWPPGERSAAYYWHWSFVAVFDVALVSTAVLDWNAWVLPRPASLVAGVVLAVAGVAIFLRSAGAMDADESMGVDGDLYTDGPYAYSRNPQYVGMLVGILGFALLVNSGYVAALAAVHAGWVLLLPRAEEPHLRELHGETYERYTVSVPRFVGVRTLRALRSSFSNR